MKRTASSHSGFAPRSRDHRRAMDLYDGSSGAEAQNARPDQTASRRKGVEPDQIVSIRGCATSNGLEWASFLPFSFARCRATNGSDSAVAVAGGRWTYREQTFSGAGADACRGRGTVNQGKGGIAGGRAEHSLAARRPWAWEAQPCSRSSRSHTSTASTASTSTAFFRRMRSRFGAPVATSWRASKRRRPNRAKSSS